MSSPAVEWSTLVRALVAVGRREHAAGRGTASPFSGVKRDPKRPDDNVEYLRGVTWRDIVGAFGPPSLIALIKAAWEPLDERQREISKARILAEKPETLHSLGARLGLSGERVRQIERDLRQSLADECEPEGTFGPILGSILAECTPVSNRKLLFEHYPVLGETIDDLGVDAWRLLSIASRALDVDGDWVASPSLPAAERTTSWGIRELETAPGVTPLARLGQTVQSYPPEMLQEWLARCGHGVCDGQVIDLSGNTVDVLERLLNAAGGALDRETLDAKLAQMGTPRASGTVAATLSRDPRFCRLGKGLWGLASWGHDEYHSVASLIGQMLADRGEVPLSEIVAEATSRRVAEASVRRTAEVAPYETVDGMVRMRPLDSSMPTRPAEALSLFRIDGGWGVLETLVRQHFAGAAVPVTSGLVAALGMSMGDTRDLIDGPRFRWTSRMPVMETISPWIEGRFAPDDRVFLWVGPDGRFEVRPARPTTPADAPGLPRAVQLVGLPDRPDDAGRLATLADAVGLASDAGLEALIDAYALKREREVVEQLLAARG